MKLPSLWSGNQSFPWSRNRGLLLDPFREVEDMLRAVERAAPSFAVGASVPTINIAEDKEGLEITAELPGVDEKDVRVSLDDNQLVISGEKKAETKKEEKDWRIEERSYGSFYRAIVLPFRPEDGSIEAFMDKGVLHLHVKKPAEGTKSAKTIEIKRKEGGALEHQSAQQPGPGQQSVEQQGAQGRPSQAQETPVEVSPKDEHPRAAE